MPSSLGSLVHQSLQFNIMHSITALATHHKCALTSLHISTAATGTVERVSPCNLMVQEICELQIEICFFSGAECSIFGR